jgi:hypothetical protein
MLSDREVKAAILEFLIKKGRWGAHYFPLDTLVNWMGKKADRNGKRVRAHLKLANERFILLHKRGSTVSLNPAMIERIRELIRTQTG